MTVSIGSGPAQSCALQQALQCILPDARLEAQLLATIPPLRLRLLAADFPRHQLDQATVLQVMDNPLYWVFCWASGQVLARFLLAQPAWVAGKRVLDFGCGSGVVAIAAAMAGAAEVIACDSDPMARASTHANAALNGVNLDTAADLQEVDGPIDLILAADVLYDPDNLAWLPLFRARARRVLVADSRVRDFRHPPYQRIASQQARTLPDLDEAAEFRTVSLYLAG